MKNKNVKTNIITFIAVFITAFVGLELIPDSFRFKIITMIALITFVAVIVSAICDYILFPKKTN